MSWFRYVEEKEGLMELKRYLDDKLEKMDFKINSPAKHKIGDEIIANNKKAIVFDIELICLGSYHWSYYVISKGEKSFNINENDIKDAIQNKV